MSRSLGLREDQQWGAALARLLDDALRTDTVPVGTGLLAMSVRAPGCVQAPRVIVDLHRQQAGSYRGMRRGLKRR